MELKTNYIVFIIMKERATRDNCVAHALVVFLDNSGALWHRELKYFRLRPRQQWLLVGSINCWFGCFHGFDDNKKNIEHEHH